MKKILLGSVALAAMIASPAMAADVAVPRRAATFVEPAPTWTGIYVGGNIGGVWGNTDPGFVAGCPGAVNGTASGVGVLPNLPTTNAGVGNCYWQLGQPLSAAGSAAANSNAAFVTQVGTQPFHNHGWTGGGQIGFNYQYQWAVFGVEADFESFRPKGSQNVTGIFPNTIFSKAAVGSPPCTLVPAGIQGCQFGLNESSQGQWMASVRGKVGAVWGNWLFYGTMGVAWAKMEFTSAYSDTTCAGVTAGVTAACGAGSVVSFSQTRAGPIGGFGLSYMFLNHWIASVEYLRAEFWGFGGDAVVPSGCLAGPGALACGGQSGIAPGVTSATLHYDTTYIENIVRFKLDYKF